MTANDCSDWYRMITALPPLIRQSRTRFTLDDMAIACLNTEFRAAGTSVQAGTVWAVNPPLDSRELKAKLI